jgi:hypothetical protein
MNVTMSLVSMIMMFMLGMFLMSMKRRILMFVMSVAVPLVRVLRVVMSPV